MHRSIEPFIHRKIVVLHENDSVYQAAKALTTNGVGSIVVSDHEAHITGVVTDRDLVTRVLSESRQTSATLKEIMSKTLASVSEHATLDEVADLMEKHGVRRIPVLREGRSGHQRCVGIISLDDLIMADAIEPRKLRSILRTQILLRHGYDPFARSSVAGRSSQDFLKLLANALGTNEREAQSFAKFVFSSIARRLNYSAAVQFALQLPYEFQPKLMELPAGPDRLITAQEIAHGVSARLKVPAEGAREPLRKLWSLLQNVAGPGPLNHAMSQLPNEIQELFNHPEPSVRHDYEEWTGA